MPHPQHLACKRICGTRIVLVSIVLMIKWKQVSFVGKYSSREFLCLHVGLCTPQEIPLPSPLWDIASFGCITAATELLNGILLELFLHPHLHLQQSFYD